MSTTETTAAAKLAKTETTSPKPRCRVHRDRRAGWRTPLAEVTR